MDVGLKKYQKHHYHFHRAELVVNELIGVVRVPEGEKINSASYYQLLFVGFASMAERCPTAEATHDWFPIPLERIQFERIQIE